MILLWLKMVVRWNILICVDFKYWLIEHPQTEDNGEQMTVPIVG